MTAAAMLLVVAVTAGPGGSSAEGAERPKPVRCLETRLVAVSGEPAPARLDCRVRRQGRTVVLASGARGVAARAVVLRPRHGVLASFRSRPGRATYRSRPGYVGRDSFRFRIRKRSGARLLGRVVVRVVAPPGERPPPGPGPQPGPDAGPDPEPPPESEPEPRPSEIPEPLPEVGHAITFDVANWSPAPVDTCPKELHERFSVIGPDGLKYPTWHPPSVIDPATGQRCTFGHEHGRDPRGSDLFEWVAGHFAAPGYERYAGVPFGVASQALEAWSGDSQPKRREDNPGYKVDFRNDVRLYSNQGADLGVTCDYLVRYHQGSHSADATSNNVHETLFAYRCDDGTELISNAFTRFGDAGEYTRACEPETVVPTTDNGYPDGEGARLIPDRACMEANFLVPAGRTTSAFVLWEQWLGENVLHKGPDPETGDALARFPTRFDVFDPSRYADPDPAAIPVPGYATRIGRPLDLCWEVEANGDRADRGFGPCWQATAGWTLPFEERPAHGDPSSPFAGAEREMRLRGARITNAGGPTRWYTDPYGGNASTAPFPGAVCQLVGSLDNSSQPELQERTFAGPDLSGQGVHAPN